MSGRSGKLVFPLDKMLAGFYSILCFKELYLYPIVNNLQRIRSGAGNNSSVKF